MCGSCRSCAAPSAEAGGRRQRRRPFALALLCCLLALGATACRHTPAPVEALGEARAPARAVPETYTVQKGDTLYGISWQHGLDFRAVARLNGIRPPYTIHPGQKLRLRGKPPAVKAPAGSAPSRPAPARPAVGGKPGAKPAPIVSTDGGRWSWPASGRLLKRYNAVAVGPKGIFIDGKPGDPVRAARDGRVVYIGSGLVGYGLIVIVKHDDVHLSAYAHNRKVLVKEGQAVRTGDVIAEIGSSGTDRAGLHFEIRRNGDPVDPLGLLPAR